MNKILSTFAIYITIFSHSTYCSESKENNEIRKEFSTTLTNKILPEGKLKRELLTHDSKGKFLLTTIFTGQNGDCLRSETSSSQPITSNELRELVNAQNMQQFKITLLVLKKIEQAEPNNTVDLKKTFIHFTGRCVDNLQQIHNNAKEENSDSTYEEA